MTAAILDSESLRLWDDLLEHRARQKHGRMI